MSETVEQIVEQEAAATQKKFNNPYEFLATIPGSPSKDTIAGWKSQTPNGRLRVFSPDNGKRVFILRAVGGKELTRLQAILPQNLDPAKAEQELQYHVGAACTLWANTTSGKLTPDELGATSAGLPVTLFQLISWLSDFIDPEMFGVVSAEL